MKKVKDIDWYNEKLKSIKKRKKYVNQIEDTKIRKRLKDDLKREQRAAKRAEKDSAKKYIENELIDYGNKDR